MKPSAVELERLRSRLAEEVRRGEAALSGALAGAEWLKREAVYDRREATESRRGLSLRERRMAAGWTMGDVARALGMAVSWVSDLELGHIACTPSIRRLYLAALKGPKPCLEPDKMLGAGDQFPGSDYP